MLLIVVRSARASVARPSPANSTNDPTTPCAAEHLGDDQDEVGRGRPARQRAMEADADDVRHRLVERLAEEDRLGLDPADPVAEHAEPVDHRRVRIGPDDGVGEGHPAAVPSSRSVDDGGQELEVDLVDDAGPGRHDAQVAEGRLGPAQELVALAVAVVLARDVEGERARRPELVDLDRVVDDEVGRDERVDLGRVVAEVAHRVAHDRQVDDRRDAGEVLEEDPRGHERDLRLGRHARVARRGASRRPRARTTPPPAWRSRFSSRILTVTGRAAEVDPVDDGVEPVDVGQPGTEGCPGAEGVDPCHRVRPRWLGTLDACKRTAPTGPPPRTGA